ISAIFKVPMEPFFQLQFFIGYFTLPKINIFDRITPVITPRKLLLSPGCYKPVSCMKMIMKA
ncbi:hypothetical protein, partial [Blautia massiliensis (ex Durand et al. 2017)]|uniref:hypothetical protein n=1 Tax=Blautia massiliensis (ex Durand et al. 2017) TaxID=1737424 RepID=UPI003569CBB6